MPRCLQVLQGVAGGRPGLHADQRAAVAVGDLAAPGPVADEAGGHDAQAAGVGEEVAAVADEPAGGDARTPAAPCRCRRCACAVISPLRWASFSMTMPWYSSGTSMMSCSMGSSTWPLSSRVGDDLRARHAELHALAAHLLDEDAQVQLAAARDLDAVGAAQVFDAQGDVHAQLALEPVLDLAQGDRLAVAGRRTGRC